MSFTPQPYQPSSDAHFTPTQGTYKELKPFRYWCQKVLPLVYDDSLSYYELLCKVVDYLNKTMEDVDTLHVDVDNLHDAYSELETDMNHKYTDISNWVNISYNDLVEYVNTYFDNLDVQEEINNKLDAMAESGELSALIVPLLLVPVDAWLAEHITNPSNPPLDTSLTLANAAAPAKTVGDLALLEYPVKQIISADDLSSLDDALNNRIYRINRTGGATIPSNMPMVGNGILYSIGWDTDGTQTKTQIFYEMTDTTIHSPRMFMRTNWGSTWTDWVEFTNTNDVISVVHNDFIEWSKVNQIIYNIKVLGISSDDVRLAISNIRNHYNGATDNAITIFSTNESGSEFTYITELANLDNTGHVEKDLVLNGKYLIICFDYDFSYLNTGDRITWDDNRCIFTKHSYYPSSTIMDTNLTLSYAAAPAKTVGDLALLEYPVKQITSADDLSSLDDALNNRIYRINRTGGATIPSNMPMVGNGILYSIGWDTDGTQTKTQIFYEMTDTTIHSPRMFMRTNWGSTWTDWVEFTNTNDVISVVHNDFIEWSTANKVIKNVKIIGITSNEVLLALSNIRNHYNGANYNEVYVFSSNNTGTEFTPITNISNLDNIGHIDTQITVNNKPITISFDYDFSYIPVGDRISGTGMNFVITPHSYYLLPINSHTNMGFIEKFGVIGDSYASGEIYTPDPTSSSGYHAEDYYSKSWGQILARRNGAECVNFSKGGLTTRTWLTDSKGLSLLNSTEAQELYMCCLGINDLIQQGYGIDYLGTLSDITSHSDPSEYDDTFYGNYGRIIEAIKAKAPIAKIIMFTFAYAYNANEESFNTAIKTIASHYNIPVIDIKENEFYSTNSIYYTGRVQNHPTAPIYAGMSEINNELITACIFNNYNYFKDFT